jgi:hypothetical protein
VFGEEGEGEGEGDDSKDGSKSQLNKGMICQIFNAIRLQASTLAPNTFLRVYVNSHDGWKECQSKLRSLTLANLKAGGGKVVPENESAMNGMGGASSGLANALRGAIDKDRMVALLPNASDKDGVDIGSDFANSMGFTDEICWPVEEESPGKKKKKAKKKKKKKKKGGEEESRPEDGEDGEDDEDGEDGGEEE